MDSQILSVCGSGETTLSRKAFSMGPNRSMKYAFKSKPVPLVGASAVVDCCNGFTKAFVVVGTTKPFDNVTVTTNRIPINFIVIQLDYVLYNRFVELITANVSVKVTTCEAIGP
jgi:hypothetical protein